MEVELTIEENKELGRMAKDADMPMGKLVIQALRLHKYIRSQQNNGLTMAWVDEHGKLINRKLHKRTS